MSITRKMRESDWFLTIEILVGLLAIAGFFISVWGFWLSIYDSRQGRIVNAWQLVTTESPGNSGKVAALQYLAKNGVSLNGIDLSCKRMGGFGGEDDEIYTIDGPVGAKDRRCVRPTYLQNLDLSKRTHGHPVEVRNANFSQADLTEADFSGADLRETRFNFAILKNANFQDSNLVGSTLQQLQGFVQISSANLTNAKIEGSQIGNFILTSQNMSSSFTHSIVNGFEIGTESPNTSYSDDHTKLFIGGSSLFNVNGKFANLSKLYLQRSEIIDSDFSSEAGEVSFDQIVNSADVSLSDVAFYNSDFANANLTNAKFRNVRFVGCNFSNSNFEKVSFDNVDLTSSKFCDEFGCAKNLNQSQLDNSIIILPKEDVEQKLLHKIPLDYSLAIEPHYAQRSSGSALNHLYFGKICYRHFEPEEEMVRNLENLTNTYNVAYQMTFHHELLSGNHLDDSPLICFKRTR